MTARVALAIIATIVALVGITAGDGDGLDMPATSPDPMTYERGN